MRQRGLRKSYRHHDQVHLQSSLLPSDHGLSVKKWHKGNELAMTLSSQPAQTQRAVPAGSWPALLLLTAVYAVSFVDRTAVSVVQDTIKAELQLSDWQIGLMIGPAFAIVYSLAGLPLARVAERYNRAHLLAWCLAIWSIMTMACGLARDFMTLFLARMGVGIGEAGGNPASHALIADLFPESRRATAIAIYTLGASLGTILGAAGVGWLASMLGWRATFLALGLPGFVLVAAIMLWLRDPRRVMAARLDHQDPDTAPPPFTAVAIDLLRNSAFRHLVWGGSLIVLVGYGVAAFLPALLVRSYQLPLGQVGLITGIVAGAGGAIGTIAGGLAGDRWAHGNPEQLARITAFAVFPAPMLLVGGIMSHSLAVLTTGAFFGLIALYGYVAPAFAQVHALAHAQNRATVTSIYYLVTNLVGLGIGPPLIGAISDWRARGILELDAGAYAQTCLRSGSAPIPGCATASAQGMETALIAISLLPLVAGVHFILVARRYRQQFE